MKQVFMVLCVVVLGVVIYSCSDQTYARQLKAEEKLIEEYIRRENINVLKNMPDENSWKPNDYVKLDNGVYFHLEKAGVMNDSIKKGDLALVRFKSYTLGIPASVVDMWSIIGIEQPPQFVWGSAGQICDAWQSALSIMMRQHSEGKVIAPSKTGFNSSNAVSSWGVSDDESSVTPRLYHLRLQIDR
ncbi:MAG: DUF4827 domain-containing protein [Prevotellaceae bacterium]|jgi:hypothetical protein|nr:DUF4827 domain-containing protein [Prevotellaceae bacterium]